MAAEKYQVIKRYKSYVLVELAFGISKEDALRKVSELKKEDPYSIFIYEALPIKEPKKKRRYTPRPPRKRKNQ